MKPFKCCSCRLQTLLAEVVGMIKWRKSYRRLQYFSKFEPNNKIFTKQRWRARSFMDINYIIVLIHWYRTLLFLSSYPIIKRRLMHISQPRCFLISAIKNFPIIDAIIPQCYDTPKNKSSHRPAMEIFDSLWGNWGAASGERSFRYQCQLNGILFGTCQIRFHQFPTLDPALTHRFK